MNDSMNPGLSGAEPTVRGDIAIIGMACTYPGARRLKDFWRNIVEKVDSVTDVPPERWDPEIFYDPDPDAEDRVYCKRGGYLGSTFAFNPLRFGTMPKAVTGAEPDQFLVLRCVHEALGDAGYLDRPINGERTEFILGRGNYLGAGLTNLIQRGQITEQTLQIIKVLHPEYSSEELKKIKAAMKSKLPGFGPEIAPGIIPNITTGRVANRFNLMGPNFTVDAACASSLIATEVAVRNLLTHHCDLALAGGVHIFTNVPFLLVFSALGALSRSSTVRPFDRRCDGTLSGEGVGVMVLKRLADAERDGDRIYSVIKGVGTSSDGKAMGVTAPRVEGEELAVRRAYNMSGLSPQTISLIEAHGTGTPVGDQTELDALHRVFGPREDGRRSIALGSIKSMIGHAMPAAGAAAMIKTALSLYHRVLPPTLHCEEPHPLLADEKSPLYVNTETRPWVNGGADHPRRAGVNAFGFGGINAHVVLEEYTGASRRNNEALVEQWECELVVVEGASRENLKANVERLGTYAASASFVALRDVAYSANTSLSGLPQRLTIVASSMSDLAEKLSRAGQRLGDPTCTQIKDTKGIYWFERPLTRDGKVAFVFPGEGAQYVNMMADLCLHFPEVRACFDAADRAVRSPDRSPPSADIFPPPALSEAEVAEAEKRLWNIERATEAVLTADGAMYTLLTRLGIKPDLITGHSAGEWIGMAASGILEVDNFLAGMNRLDDMYSQLRSDTTVPEMAMLAIGTDRDTVRRLAGEIGRTIHIANDNCPHQVVIVCEPADAKPIASQLLKHGFFVEQLPYDRGYHTPVFTYICEPLRNYFSSLSIQSPRFDLYSCTTAKPYPAEPARILDIASDTFARPLLFRDTIEAMYAAGARVFIEVGPRSNLTAFIDDILRGQTHAAVATNAHRRSGLHSLHHALAQLAAHHVPMDLEYLYERRSPRRLSWDARKDTPIDEDAAVGTMQVPLWYPTMSIDESCRPQAKPALSQSHAVQVPVPVTHESKVTPIAVSAVATPPSAGQSADVVETPVPAGSTQVMQEHLQMMEAFLSTQQEVMQAYLGVRTSTEAVRSSSIPSPLPSKAEEVTSISPPSAEIPVLYGTPTELSPSKPAVAPTPTAVVTEAVAAPESATSGGDLERILVSIVSEKTGYPPEMLNLDLDMEADLGIDSIKRIEILGTLQKMADGVLATPEIDMEQVAKLKTLRQVLLFLAGSTATAGASRSIASTEPDASKLTFKGIVIRHTPGAEVVIRRIVDIAEEKYLDDHRFGPILSDADPTLGALPVVPLTVSIETMAEVATLLMPGLKVIGVKDVQASKWIDIEKDGAKAALEITAKVVGERSVRVAICEEQPAETATSALSSPVAEATVLFDTTYPTPPTIEEIQLTNRRPCMHKADELYSQRRMFHGPSFQGVVSLDAVGENGLLAQLEVLPTNQLLKSNSAPKFHIDPFLLDAAGQLVGYWPVEYLKEGFVLFPIRVNELHLYRENLKPGDRSICQLRIRHVAQRQLRADLDIIGPDGKLWMRIVGWEDWRFYWPVSFYDFWRFPNQGIVSEKLELRLPSGHEDAECRRMAPFGEMGSSIWENLWAHLIMSRRELKQYHDMSIDRRRTEWIFGRAAAKDAVRMWVKRHHRLDLYPADVEIVPDPKGKPIPDGHWVATIGERPELSLSHKGSVAVAIAGRGLLGIDLETIEPREPSFDAAAFNERERSILHTVGGDDREEWVARLWSAKEAAGKAMGRGLENGPGTMVVRKIDAGDGKVIVGFGTNASVVTEGGSEFVVHTIRDGDMVLAVAAYGRNGHGE